MESISYIISIERLLGKYPSIYIKDKYRDYILNGHSIENRMIIPSRIEKNNLFKRGILVKIKDSHENLIAIHKVQDENIISDIKEKKLNLTKSIVIFQ